ncbi:MAG TPA: hypothetical protein VF585_08465 [Chthoniobacterales bacterium]|jgi:hypothetical protein
MFPFLTQLFLYGFCIDAVLSFWAEMYQIQNGSFAEIRMLIALSALAQGTILFFSMPFTRRVSFRLVGIPVLFLLWKDLTSGFPLPFFYLEKAGVWLAGAQMLIAFVLVGTRWGSHAANGGPGFVDPAAGREGFTWPRFLRFAAANLLFLPLLVIATVVGSAVRTIDTATAGYVRLRPSGLYMTQASFKKNQDTVALNGMMHIADPDFYQKMKWGADGVRTLVLLEGVTDQNNLLTKGLGMEKLAKLFGLETQGQSGEYQEAAGKLTGQGGNALPTDQTIEMKDSVDIRRADVDVNTFRPQTIDYLKAMALLFQSTNSGKMQDFVRVMEEKKSVLQNDAVVRGAMEDVLTNRNTYLIKQIEKGLETHDRLVVPWGAMHLAGIEAYLLSKGFAEVSREEKPAVLFWKKKDGK